MSTPKQKNRKLKVKFVGRFRDYIQCRKTKVRITMEPRYLEDQIKYHLDTARDMENILEVIEQVDLKNERPSVGELLLRTSSGWMNDDDPEFWSKRPKGDRKIYQEWAERFIGVLQDELYLTEELQRGEADDYSKHKKDTVKAIQEILERR